MIRRNCNFDKQSELINELSSYDKQNILKETPESDMFDTNTPSSQLDTKIKNRCYSTNHEKESNDSIFKFKRSFTHKSLRLQHQVPSAYHSLLITGYRQTDIRFFGSLNYLLIMNNATPDILSHALAVFYFCLQIKQHFSLYGSIEEDTAENPDNMLGTWINENNIWFIAFFIGTMSTFFFSTIYHTFNVVSPNVFGILLRLDHTGIVMGFIPCTTMTIFKSFPNETYLQIFYVGLLFILALICALQCWSKNKEGKWGMLTKDDILYFHERNYMLKYLIGIGFIIIPHCAYSLKSWDMFYEMMKVGLFYGFGYYCFITGFPENRIGSQYFSDYNYTVFIKSHSVWHVAVSIGAAKCYNLTLHLMAASLEHHNTTNGVVAVNQ